MSRRLPLGAHSCSMEKYHKRYYFAPPLLFSVFHEDFRLKITVKNPKARAKFASKMDSECLGTLDGASHFPDIHLFVWPEETQECVFMSANVY